MVSREGSTTPQPDALEREANRAHLWLFVVAVVSALSFVVVSGLGLIVNDSSVERAGVFCWLPIPIVAVLLALRHAAAISSDFTIRGRFSSMGSVFGIVFFLTFLATVPEWESVLWGVGSAAGTWAWRLVRVDKHLGRGRARG